MRRLAKMIEGLLESRVDLASNGIDVHITRKKGRALKE